MKVIGVIPSRMGSTRFPNKPMALIQGKPMIQWVIESARKCKNLDRLLVATDHKDIARACEAIGCEAVMTDSNLASGTDRLFAAIQNSSEDVIVNIQGDEPFIEAGHIEQLLQFYKVSRSDWPSMSTLACPFTKNEDYQSLNCVKVVINQKSEALYFSRFPIPLSRQTHEEVGFLGYRHLGLYAYTKEFLKTFCESPVSALEKAESLEQLRALDLGAKIKVGLVKEAPMGVDTPEDLKKIEYFLNSKK